MEVPYECRSCKAINYFEPDADLQLLVENKKPNKTFQIKSKEEIKAQSKTYRLICSQCGATNMVEF